LVTITRGLEDLKKKVGWGGIEKGRKKMGNGFDGD